MSQGTDTAATLGSSYARTAHRYHTDIDHGARWVELANPYRYFRGKWEVTYREITSGDTHLRTIMHPTSNLPPKPLDDLPACVDIIAQITGTDPADVTRTLRAEHARIGTAVSRDIRTRGVKPHVMSPAMHEFYAATNAFLYETLVWNRFKTKHVLRSRVLAFLEKHCPRPARVLVFGDGLGFDCTALAAAGYEVMYLEVGEKSEAFAREVFRRNAVTVEVQHDLQAVAPGSCDAVVCLDVLEHVENPPELVSELAHRLTSGGLLITHAPFAYIGPSVCTHLRTNVRYSGDIKRLYAPADLTPIDGSALWMPVVLEKAAGRSHRTFGMRARLLWTLGRLFLRGVSLWPAFFALCCEANAFRECRRLVAQTAWNEPE